MNTGMNPDPSPSQKDIKRAALMLRVAAEYIRDYWPEEIIHYDDADCDGYCVADDCETMADALDESEVTE